MDILFAHNEKKGKEFTEKLKGKNPGFICVIGNTETAKIPGISVAGANPEITDFTPAADCELLYYGECKCISGVPITPDGIPTPGLITMSALNLVDLSKLVVIGGVRVYPQIPYVEVGGSPGGDIRTGKAVKDVKEVIARSKILGENLVKYCNNLNYLVIGESIAGGTTTTLGVLSAMGIEGKGKVSSSMPVNPHKLKEEIIELGMKSANIEFGSCKNDPIKAIECLGDPMIPAYAGLVLGAGKKIPILLAGGTQMTSVLAVVNSIDQKVLNNLAIGTTRWIVEDKQSDIKGIVDQIGQIPILAVNLDFNKLKAEGLKAYEKDIAKEGVGAGGSSIAALLKNKKLNTHILLEEIEKNYDLLIKKK
ncbi:MAG: TIGR00303 family protein [Candidatus Helarchaeota archaeon]|nr:TIGR00303 family protein [Candidatus Helarchaeota archaeon]